MGTSGTVRTYPAARWGLLSPTTAHLRGDGVTVGRKLARIARVAAMAVVCLTACVLPATSAGARAAAKTSAPHYYLALGDWLATGIGASSSAERLREPGRRTRGQPLCELAGGRPGVWGSDDGLDGRRSGLLVHDRYPARRCRRLPAGPPPPGGVCDDRHRGRRARSLSNVFRGRQCLRRRRHQPDLDRSSPGAGPSSKRPVPGSPSTGWTTTTRSWPTGLPEPRDRRSPPSPPPAPTSSTLCSSRSTRPPEHRRLIRPRSSRRTTPT